MKRVYPINFAAIILCLTIFIAIANTAQNPNIHFEHISVEKGLSHNLTSCILQDKEGFIWFGTLNGLIRYDGKKQLVYRHDPFNIKSISSNKVICLLEDNEGYIWIGTYGGGLNRFNKETAVFENFQHDTGDSTSISSNIIHTLHQGKNGTIWIGSKTGLNKLIVDKTGDSVKIVFSTYRLADNNNHCSLIIENNQGKLITHFMGSGLYFFNTVNETFIKIEMIGENNLLKNISWIHENRNGGLWLATLGSGLLEINAEFTDSSAVITEYKQFNTKTNFSTNNVWCVIEDKSDNLWIGTDDGLYRLTYISRDSIKLESFKHNPYDEYSLSSNYISTIFEDNSGIIWLGTYKGEIDKLIPDQEIFQHYKIDIQDTKSLSMNEVSAICEDKSGNVWIGTSGSGLYYFDTKDGTYTNYSHDPHNPQSISHNSIAEIIEDNNGTIWIGTFKGLNKLNNNESFSHYFDDDKSQFSVGNNLITALIQANDGLLWVGVYNKGLYLLNPKTKHFKRIKHDSEDSLSLSSDYILSLYQDIENSIWIGTAKGLDRLISLSDTKDLIIKASFEHHTHNPMDKNSISSNQVYCMLEDENEAIWFGTDHGLNKFSKKKNEFTYYDNNDGLPGNTICGILKDVEGNIWISTYNGISRFNPLTKEFTNYASLHGLQDMVFNKGAFTKGSNGNLYFGGVNGFNIFKSDNIKKNMHKPPIYLTSFKIFNKEIHFKKRCEFIDKIDLSYDKNFFTFDFAALDYFAPEQNNYHYHLQGYDKNWIDNGAKSSASYTGVPPGSYIFKVKASNSDGIWNDKELSIPVNISPPFWLTWWFKSITLIVIILILIITVRIVIRNAKRKLEIDKKISELRLQALRARMNPHFIFNTINSIQYYITNNDHFLALQFLSKFSKLMRSTLENSEKSIIPLIEEIEMLKLYLDLQLLRFGNKFTYEIIIDDLIDINKIEIPTLLIQPYIENAITHGFIETRENGKIDIIIKMKNDVLVCIIEDNGIGISKALELKKNVKNTHKSTAMRVTKERLNILNAANRSGINVRVNDLSEDDSGLCGTKVILHIPV